MDLFCKIVLEFENNQSEPLQHFTYHHVKIERLLKWLKLILR